MAGDLTVKEGGALTAKSTSITLPAIVTSAGNVAEKRFIEFFAAQIRNKNTREAYVRAVLDFFTWAEEVEIGGLLDIEPIHVAAWVEMKTDNYEPQTVKQQLAALRHLFDWLVTGHVLDTNPAAFVRGPKFSYTKGKTPILTPEEARRLIRAIPLDTITGLRDRALIGVMIYSFARISAALKMNVKDVFTKRETLWVRLHEKGGKYHEMPCQHNLKDWLQEYIEAAGISEEDNNPLFRPIDIKTKELTDRRMTRQRAWEMVKRRTQQAGIKTQGVCNHTFRGTGITAYLENPEGRLEHAQQMAAHSDPKTTRLYDRRDEEVSMDEVERIGI